MGMKARAQTRPAGSGQSPRPARNTAKAAATSKPRPATSKPTRRTAPARENTAENTVDRYIAGFADWRGQVVAELRRIIRQAAPEAEEAIKWAQPVYSLGGPLCYVKAFHGHVNLGFWRGMQMSDPGNLLVGKGGQMAHVKISGPGDVRADAFRALVEEAVALNRAHGDPTRHQG